MASTTILSDNGASSGSAGLKQTAGNDGVLILQTTTSGGTATNAVYVDTSQQIGISATPNTWYAGRKVLQGGSGTLMLTTGNNAHATLFANTYENAAGQLIYQNTGSASYYQQYNGVHSWFSSPSGTGGTQASTYPQVLAVGKALTLALEGATSQSGTGISFPAVLNASSDVNTLDDYEEGTFSPRIAGTGASGTPTYASDGQIGRYTKIGNRCYFNIWLNWTNISGASGQLRVLDLPFTAKAVTGAYSCVNVYMDASVTLGASGVIQGYLPTGDTYIYLSYYTSGGSNAAGISIDTVGALMISGHYEVN